MSNLKYAYWLNSIEQICMRWAIKIASVLSNSRWCLPQLSWAANKLSIILFGVQFWIYIIQLGETHVMTKYVISNMLGNVYVSIVQLVLSGGDLCSTLCEVCTPQCCLLLAPRGVVFHPERLFPDIVIWIKVPSGCISLFWYRLPQVWLCLQAVVT